MADYFLIFCACLILNIAITARSSTLWPQIAAKIFSILNRGGTSANQSGAQSTVDNSDSRPLVVGDAASGRKPSEQADKSSVHKNLIRRYLIVYLLAALSDWLQGPYVYALYNAYGYSQHDIAILFVAGFGSSEFYRIRCFTMNIENKAENGLQCLECLFIFQDIVAEFVFFKFAGMVFGSFVGGLADGCGRRKFVVLYAATYAASCATKRKSSSFG